MNTIKASYSKVFNMKFNNAWSLIYIMSHRCDGDIVHTFALAAGSLLANWYKLCVVVLHIKVVLATSYSK